MGLRSLALLYENFDRFKDKSKGSGIGQGTKL